MSPDRILIAMACAAFGLAVFYMMPSGQNTGNGVIVTGPTPAEAARIAAEEVQTRAAALQAEAEERKRAQARIKVEQTQEQARIFNQRYNTDRMPVGSVNSGEAPAPAAPPPQGFSVVKPVQPPGQSSGAFREVKWGKPVNPPQ